MSLKQQQQQVLYQIDADVAIHDAKAPVHATLGDRMKALEEPECKRKLRKDQPIMVRLDGRHFSTFTRGLRRPFDPDFIECMKQAARAVMNDSGAILAYTQSDEISLVIPACQENQEHIFAGRVQKLCSNLAALASVVFLRAVQIRLPAQYANKFPTFDCRAWNVPSLDEAANAILWRERDAEKNSISMLAQSVFSARDLHKKNSTDKLEMLRAKGIVWEERPTCFTRGTYLKRVRSDSFLSPAEMSNLPAKHHAAVPRNDGLEEGIIVERSEVVEVPMPRLTDQKEKVKLLFGA